MRWLNVSGYCGAPITQGQALRFSVIGSFFNQTLPPLQAGTPCVYG
jgi:hypothetical protein